MGKCITSVSQVHHPCKSILEISTVLYNDRMIDFQRKILADTLRNDAFAKALRNVIVSGKSVVLDIGSGTGFLPFLAAKLGAKEVIAIEHNPAALALSKALAKENGIRNCRFIGKHSSQVTERIQADIIVSETLGNFAFEEHLIENMNDAKRFLRPGGTIIPQSLMQFVCPVISREPLMDIDTWDIGFDLSFNAAREIGLQNMYVKTVEPSHLLTAGTQEWDSLDFHKREKSVRTAEVHWTLDRNAEITGFALFWDSELLPGITISTAPGKPKTHWEQVLLPLLTTITAQRGDEVSLTLRSDSRPEVGLRVTWDVVHRRSGSILLEEKHDTARG